MGYSKCTQTLHYTYHTWLQFTISKISYQVQTNFNFISFQIIIHEILSSTLLWILCPNMLLHNTIIAFKPQFPKPHTSTISSDFLFFFSFNIYESLSSTLAWILHPNKVLHSTILVLKSQSPKIHTKCKWTPICFLFSLSQHPWSSLLYAYMEFAPPTWYCTISYLASSPNLQKLIPSASELPLNLFLFYFQCSWNSPLYTYVDYAPPC